MKKKLSAQGCFCEHLIVTAVDVKKFHPTKSRRHVQNIYLSHNIFCDSNFMHNFIAPSDFFNHLLVNREIRSKLMFGEESGFLCVYVGRISNEKRIDIIIDAVRELTGEGNSYIAIIGECFG